MCIPQVGKLRQINRIRVAKDFNVDYKSFATRGNVQLVNDCRDSGKKNAEVHSVKMPSKHFFTETTRGNY